MTIQALTPGFCYCRDKPAVYAGTAITIVSLIAISIILSGKVTTPGCCLATCLTMSLNALIIATYLLTSSNSKAADGQKSNKQSANQKGNEQSTKPQEITKVQIEGSYKPLPLPRSISQQFNQLNQKEAEETSKKKQAPKKAAKSKSPSNVASPALGSPPKIKKKPTPPLSPDTLPPASEIPKKAPLTIDDFTGKLMPKLHEATFGLFERLVAAEGSKNASETVVSERVSKLRASKTAILGLSAQIATNYQKERSPAEPSQLLRRMVVAFNIEDFQQLDRLVVEFGRTQKGEQNPPHKLDSEEKIKALYKEILFKTKWILAEIEMLTSPTDPNHPADAIYFHIMGEASKELARYSTSSRGEFESNLKHLAQHHLDTPSGGKKCLDYMWIRKPSKTEEIHFDKISKCLVANGGTVLSNDHKSHSYAPSGYQAIGVTLGGPWTWKAKTGKDGIGKAYSALNSGLAQMALQISWLQQGASWAIENFSGYLIPSITKGMTNMGLVQKGETYLDKPVEQLLLAILTPLLNTYTDKNGVKGPVMTAIGKTKTALDKALDDLETKDLEAVVESLTKDLGSIQFDIKSV